MTTQTEALKLALEALEKAEESVRMVERMGMRLGLSDTDLRMDKETIFKPAISAIKEALAQQEQRNVSEHLKERSSDEPVACVAEVSTYDGYLRKEVVWNKRIDSFSLGTRFYTTPPQRKPLTDDELDLMCEKALFCRISFQQFARSIEAAHGITASEAEGSQQRSKT